MDVETYPSLVGEGGEEYGVLPGRCKVRVGSAQRLQVAAYQAERAHGSVDLDDDRFALRSKSWRVVRRRQDGEVVRAAEHGRRCHRGSHNPQTDLYFSTMLSA